MPWPKFAAKVRALLIDFRQTLVFNARFPHASSQHPPDMTLYSITVTFEEHRDRHSPDVAVPRPVVGEWHMIIYVLSMLVILLSFSFGSIEILIPLTCFVGQRSVLMITNFANSNRLNDDPCWWLRQKTINSVYRRFSSMVSCMALVSSRQELKSSLCCWL